MMISVKELRSKSADELRKQLVELRREQFNCRIQLASMQFANTARFKDLRRDIARIKTVLNEKLEQ